MAWQTSLGNYMKLPCFYYFFSAGLNVEHMKFHTGWSHHHRAWYKIPFLQAQKKFSKHVKVGKTHEKHMKTDWWMLIQSTGLLLKHPTIVSFSLRASTGAFCWMLQVVLDALPVGQMEGRYWIGEVKRHIYPSSSVCFGLYIYIVSCASLFIYKFVYLSIDPN